MMRRRPFVGLLAVGLLVVTAVLPAGPAAAGSCQLVECGPDPQPCLFVTCPTVQFWSDITVTADESSDPAWPGGSHTYTFWVTNTGYVSIGGAPAVPTTHGPASGHVYIVIAPSSPEDVPIRGYNGSSSGGLHCSGYGPTHGIVCDAVSIPVNTTYDNTETFQTPLWNGTYTCEIYADTPGWDEYNEQNNSVTLTYHVSTGGLP